MPKPFVFPGISLASEMLASPACSCAKGSAQSDRCVCCALLWGLAAVPSANASFLGQCFWKPWELNKHLCCSPVYSQALQITWKANLLHFLQPIYCTVLSPKNTQGYQWNLGMHIAHGSLNVCHYSANNIKNTVQTVNVSIFSLKYFTRNLVHVYLTIFSSIAQNMQNRRYSYDNQ